MIDRKPRSVKRVLLAVWRRHLVFRRSYLAFLWGFWAVIAAAMTFSDAARWIERMVLRGRDMTKWR